MDEKISSKSKPRTPCPDEDVGHYSNRCKAHQALYPVVVEFLSFLIAESGN
jgi:hypothetical protein